MAYFLPILILCIAFLNKILFYAPNLCSTSIHPHALLMGFLPLRGSYRIPPLLEFPNTKATTTFIHTHTQLMGFTPLGGGYKIPLLLGFLPLWGSFLYAPLMGFSHSEASRRLTYGLFLSHPTGVETLRYEIFLTQSPPLYCRDFSSQSSHLIFHWWKFFHSKHNH